jgi:hypothetical protein
VVHRLGSRRSGYVLGAASCAALVLAVAWAALWCLSAGCTAGASETSQSQNCEARYAVGQAQRLFKTAAESVEHCERLARQDVHAFCGQQGIDGWREISGRITFMKGGTERPFHAGCGRKTLIRRNAYAALKDGNLVVYAGECGQLEDEVLGLLVRSDFAGLEKMEESLRTPTAVTSIGGSKRDLFYEAFAEAVDLPAVRDLVEIWVRTRPRSLAAHLALVRVLTASAWAARGAGFADTVTDEGRQRFTELCELSWTAAMEAQRVAPSDPTVYSHLVELGMALGKPRPVVEKAFADGLKLDPRNARLHRTMANYLSPSWYGSGEEFVQFAKETRQRVGVETFMRVVTLAMSADRAEFVRRYPNWWPELRQAFVEWERAYPTSAFAAHLFAWAACQYQDRETAQQTLAKLGKEWNGDVRYVWGTAEALESARTWAAGGTESWALPRPPNHPDALREKCDAGDGRACAQLARQHERGRVVAWDKEHSCALHEKACRLGIYSSCFQSAACRTGGKPETMDRGLAASMARDCCQAAGGQACDAGDIARMVAEMLTPTPAPPPLGIFCATRVAGVPEPYRSPWKTEDDCRAFARQKALEHCRTRGLGATEAVSVGYGLEQTDANGRTDTSTKGASFACTAR